MKKVKLAIVMQLVFFVAFAEKAQNSKTDLSRIDTTKKIITVQISCGECQFHLKGKGCHLAVKINDKAYFLDGANIDDFGDAHAKEGFCNAIRKAEVQGKIKKQRFIVSYIKLLPISSS